MTRVPAYYLENRTAEILDAAWACFARRGYHQTTMQDIAAEVDLTPGALYRYYRSKEAILLAISERSRDADAALFAGATQTAGEPIEALETLRETMLAHFGSPDFDTAARVAVELRPEYLRNETLLASAREDLELVRSSLVELMTQARARGQLRPEADPEALAVIALCLNEGMRFFRLLDPERFDLERCLDLLRTLLTPPAAGERAN